MRQYKDEKGYQLTVDSIQGDDSFSGILEGSAYMVRKMRFIKAKRDIEQNLGVLYWGLDELEKEIESLERTTDIWPPKERWVAFVGVSSYLGKNGDVYKYENKRLKIVWFQEGGDPMETLKNIISKIDFLSLCVTEITDEYD